LLLRKRTGHRIGIVFLRPAVQSMIHHGESTVFPALKALLAGPMHTVTESYYRPIDALLAGYCAGALDRLTHSLVASHLLLKPDNRAFVAALEGLAAQEVEHLAPVPLPSRDQKLAAIFGSSDTMRIAPGSSTLPAPLMRLIGTDVSDLKWRSKLPGVREYRVAESGRGEASLLWVRGGRRMPAHTHEGSELTLVLKGGFSDTTGHYCRGDIAIAEDDLDHKPMTNDREDCLCFIVTDAPLHLTGPVGRILDRFFGRH
jgi:putative transcriptional regulator